MAKKRIVMALGHRALGTNLPEQKAAVKDTAKRVAGGFSPQQRPPSGDDPYGDE